MSPSLKRLLKALAWTFYGALMFTIGLLPGKPLGSELMGMAAMFSFFAAFMTIWDGDFPGSRHV